jgi:acyl-CoA synthetase (AMP-forming)/AMP-acid ligase II
MKAPPLKFSVEALVEHAREQRDRPVWVGAAGTSSWTDFGQMVEAVRRQCLAAGVKAGSVVVTPGDSTLEALAWLFGAAAVGAVVAPVRQSRSAEVEAWSHFVAIGWRVGRRGLQRVGEGSNSPSAGDLLPRLLDLGHAGLILATGGTTGTAKLVLHDLNAVLSTVPLRNGRDWRILPLMRFDHIGGLDAAWRALASRQVLVEPPAEITPAAVARVIAQHQVEVMSATPSFLNLLLLSGAGSTGELASLRVIPFGAEPMPPSLLARLRAALPQATFVERFGTSETGTLPVEATSTGLQLRANGSGFSWRVMDGELWVKSPARALGYLDGHSFGVDGEGWFRTGDLAEVAPDGAVRILGRQEELMNVGGEKVLPDEVEAALLAHPEVADCRVRPEPNALLGQMVVADVVWSGAETDAVAVKRLLHAFAGDVLAPHKLPTRVRLVPAVDATRNLKKLRRRS